MSNKYIVKARVLQGSVAGPGLYMFCNSNLTTAHTVIGTFADDAVFCTKNQVLIATYNKLQYNLPNLGLFSILNRLNNGKFSKSVWLLNNICIFLCTHFYD